MQIFAKMENSNLKTLLKFMLKRISFYSRFQLSDRFFSYYSTNLFFQRIHIFSSDDIFLLRLNNLSRFEGLAVVVFHSKFQDVRGLKRVEVFEITREFEVVSRKK